MLESKLDFNQKMIDGHTKYVEEQESSARTYATQVLGVITKKKTTENKRAKQVIFVFTVTSIISCYTSLYYTG